MNTGVSWTASVSAARLVVADRPGKARIKIDISATGKIVSVELIQSTGSAILDREAVRIPMKVGSFPAPPAGSNSELIFPISWRIDE